MRRMVTTLALFTALGFSISAKADTIKTFNVTDVTFLSGATGSGTVTIDTTLGTYLSTDFTYNTGASTLVFDTISGQAPFNNATQYYFYSFDASGNTLDLGVPGPNLVGFNGGTICTDTNACAGFVGYVVNAGVTDLQVTGSLTETPEPSSLIMLGTGALGLIGVGRQRWKESRA